jgi:hypothetical protein
MMLQISGEIIERASWLAFGLVMAFALGGVVVLGVAIKMLTSGKYRIWR